MDARDRQEQRFEQAVQEQKGHGQVTADKWNQ
jgi:hypothetical protein